MKQLFQTLGISLGVTAMAPFSAFAAPPVSPSNPKIASDVLAVDPSSPGIPVIIQYKSDPTSYKNSVIAALGGKVKGNLHSVNGLKATVAASAINDLASDSDILYISRDHAVAAKQVSITSAEYTTEPINAPLAWSLGLDGSGIGIAVIDSGITAVDDLSAAQIGKRGGLASRIVYSQSFVPGDASTADAYGHGTHVAGLIAGNGNDSTGPAYFRTFSGVAPNANLINLRVLDQNGAGSDSAVISAIEQAIALKKQYNIRVINLSLGRPIYESYKLDPMCQAVEQAWKAGIVVVVAAGNDGRDLALNPEGYGTIEAPGNDPYALTVGAMRTMGTPGIQDDLIASYSSKGPSFIDHVVKPDLVAPGNLVTSLKFGGDRLSVDNPTFYTPDSFYMVNGSSQPSVNYFPLSGTSMAAGVTSGAVALLLQADPFATPDQMKAYLMLSADRKYFPKTSSVTDPATGTVYNANYDIFTVGAGYLDIVNTMVNAVEKPFMPAGTAMSPIAVYNPANNTVGIQADPSSLWGSTILWGASNVYGANAVSNGNVNSSTILWGGTILWGASDPKGFTILWGANSPWATSSPQAATILWGAESNNSSTILWGADGDSSNTILWGASTNNQSQTILWGASTPANQ